MIFGKTPLAEARGAILAHGVRLVDQSFKKGRVLSAEDVAALAAAGHSHVIAARLGPDDVPEDEAAHRITLAITGTLARAQEAFTGRANIYSLSAGLVVLDEARLNAINTLDESLTIATLPNLARVSPRQMLATVKIIPFAVPRVVLEQALAIINGGPLLRVAAFESWKAGLIITQLPQTKSSLVEKSRQSMKNRLEALGSVLAEVVTVPHKTEAVQAAIAQQHREGLSPILVFGASAIVDRADVIPQALVEQGGSVIHLGMPVDPGNLSMVGDLAGTPVIGVPSCARSPKTNGFDWILERVLSGVGVDRASLMRMGVGGLLAEIPSRPAPREPQAPSAPRVVAILLAAGLSRRMGRNKLLEDFEGEPMVRVTARNILASSIDELVVVTGHDREKVEAALSGLPCRCVHNADFATGLSSSLAVGVQAVGQVDAVAVCLSDMPRVRASTLDRLIAAFNPTEHRSIVVPTCKGEFGNPVLWGAEHFALLQGLSGDKGARALISGLRSEATEVDVGDPSVLMDADTPEAMAELKALRAE